MSVIFKSLMNVTGRKDIFPFYHLVSNDTPSHIKHLYNIRSIPQFEHDIDFILKHYEPSSLSDYVGKKHTSKPKVVFSFDDGLREVHDIVAPIFKKKGIPAIVFINTAFVDNQGLFFRYKVSLILDHFASNQIQEEGMDLLKLVYKDTQKIDALAVQYGIDFNDYLKSEKPYMNIEQLTDLKINSDFLIGAHSIDHPMYNQISFEEQIRQTKKSSAFVDQNIPDQLKTFAFPFTDHGVSDVFFKKIFNENIADFTFGTAGMKNEYIQNHIQRIPMEVGKIKAQNALQREMIGYTLKGLIGRTTVKR